MEIPERCLVPRLHLLPQVRFVGEEPSPVVPVNRQRDGVAGLGCKFIIYAPSLEEAGAIGGHLEACL